MARKLAPGGLFTLGSGSSLADATRGGGNDGARGGRWDGAPPTSDGPLSDNHFSVSDNHDDNVDDAGSMPSVPGSQSRRRTYGGYGWAGQGPGPSSVRTRCPPPPLPPLLLPPLSFPFVCCTPYAVHCDRQYSLHCILLKKYFAPSFIIA